MKTTLYNLVRHVLNLIFALMGFLTFIFAIITFYISVLTWWEAPLFNNTSPFDQYLNTPFITNILNLQEETFSLASAFLNSIVIGAIYLVGTAVLFGITILSLKSSRKAEDLYQKAFVANYLEKEDVSHEEVERIKKEMDKTKDQGIMAALENLFRLKK